MPTKTKAADLFKEGGRQRILEGRYVVAGVPVLIEQTDACYDQHLVHARLPGDMRESWGQDIRLPVVFQLATVEQLDTAITDFFNRFKDPLAPCPACSQMTWNRKNFPSQYRDERCGDCWFKDFDAQMTTMRGQMEEFQRKNDVAQYMQGMRYNTPVWIHPRAGDDFEVDVYTSEKPTTEAVQARMRQKYPDANLIEVGKTYQLPSH